MNRTSSRPKVVVAADGRGVVGHAGARLLIDLAEATGLSAAMSEALAAVRQRDRGHDPGRVAVDVAVPLVDGGETIAAGGQTASAIRGSAPTWRPQGFGVASRPSIDQRGERTG